MFIGEGLWMRQKSLHMKAIFYMGLQEKFELSSVLRDQCNAVTPKEKIFSSKMLTVVPVWCQP
jgi:hypothetical protein